MIESTRRTFVAGVGSAVAAGVLVPARPLEAKMIEPKTVTEQMMYCTARIAGLNTSGVPFKTGTGFFYHFPVASGDDRNIPLLVTNKHVVDGVTHAEFLIHTTSTEGPKPDGVARVQSKPTDWIPHPNSKVDLCALPIGGVLNEIKPTPFYRPLGPTIVPSDVQLQDLSAVEDILMIGYPNGLWDSVNNYPLIRRGITASHPAVDFMIDDVATMVVDIACFAGSSGSPVILHNQGSYSDKQGILKIGSRTMLLGVLFSGPVMQADGKIIIRNIPTVLEPIAQVNMMINLGYIVKAKEFAALTAAVLATSAKPPSP